MSAAAESNEQTNDATLPVDYPETAELTRGQKGNLTKAHNVMLKADKALNDAINDESVDDTKLDELEQEASEAVEGWNTFVGTLTPEVLPEDEKLPGDGPDADHGIRSDVENRDGVDDYEEALGNDEDAPKIDIPHSARDLDQKPAVRNSASDTPSQAARRPARKISHLPASAKNLRVENKPSSKVNAMLAEARQRFQQGNAVDRESLPRTHEESNNALAETMMEVARVSADLAETNEALRQSLIMNDRLADVDRTLKAAVSTTEGGAVRISGHDIGGMTEVYASQYGATGTPITTVVMHTVTIESGVIDSMVIPNAYIQENPPGFFKITSRAG